MNSDILNGRKRRPTHPGELLKEITLPAAGITQTELADKLGVSRRTINEILNERRSVSVDMAPRLALFFGGTADFWLNMQRAVDTWDAMQAHKKEWARIKPLEKTVGI